MDQLGEMKDFEYNKSWFLFKCRCGYGSNKTRKALKHLATHRVVLMDGDNHIKIKGVFECQCGHTFASNQLSIIYQSGMLRRMSMDCEKCKTRLRPLVRCGRRLVSDNVLALLCRWKLSMKQLPAQYYSGQFHKGLDHKSHLCEACELGVCQTRDLINYDPANFFHIKNFDLNKHQVVSLQNQFDILTLADSVISGATSL
jgi:hypothetical protein